MELKPKTIRELQTIIKTDYGTTLSEAEANELGVSLLKLTRVALEATARAEEGKASVTPSCTE